MSNYAVQKHHGLIGLWAVAECGLGGIMHALRIPLTGIVIGSISAMCLYFIAIYGTQKRTAILRAGAMVLMIKLMASPQSPWQAYVAVAFQILMALILFCGKEIRPWQLWTFTLLTQLESATQRILITVLIFGQSFFKALDKSAQAILQWLGIDFQASLVIMVILVYVFFHLLTGIILALWLPDLQDEVDQLRPNVSSISMEANATKRNQWPKFFIVMLIGLTLPLIMAWLLEDMNLFYIIIRVLVISLIFIFFLNPVVRWLIKKAAGKYASPTEIENIMTDLPTLIQYYGAHAQWAAKEFSGLKKIKFIFVSLLYASVKPENHGQ